MSNNNGIITAPVSLHADVYTVLGLAKTGTYYDLATVCANAHGRINKWSKHKPVKNNTPQELTDSQMASSNFGFAPQKIESLAQLGRDGVAFTNEWTYQPPTPGTDWCRMTDFNLYNHQAVCPLLEVSWPSRVLVDGSFGVSIGMTKSDYDNNPLTARDIADCLGLHDKCYLWMQALTSSMANIGYGTANMTSVSTSATGLAVSMDLGGKAKAGDTIGLYLFASPTNTFSELGSAGRYDIRASNQILAYKQYIVQKIPIRVNVTLNTFILNIESTPNGKTCYYVDPFDRQIYSFTQLIADADVTCYWAIMGNYPAKSVDFYIYGTGFRASDGSEDYLIARQDPNDYRGKIAFYSNDSSGLEKTEKLAFWGKSFYYYENLDDAINDDSGKRKRTNARYIIFDAAIDKSTRQADPLVGRTLYFQMDIPPIESDTYGYDFWYFNAEYKL